MVIVYENSFVVFIEIIKIENCIVFQDIILWLRELKQILLKLQEYEVCICIVEWMLSFGIWEYNLQIGMLNWFRYVFDIYGIFFI